VVRTAAAPHYNTINLLAVWLTCSGVLLYKSQQDAHVTEFTLSDNCSTCFGHYYHTSSGSHTTVTTASGKCYTVIYRVKFNDKEYLYIKLKLQLLLIMYIVR